MRRSQRSRGGQLRIIEATIAAILIFFSFLTATYFTRNPRVWTISRSEDITRMGYNVLHSLSFTDVLNNTIGSGKVGWEQEVKFILEALLPSTSYFNMTVYRVLSTSDMQNIKLTPYNTMKITNAESGAVFTDSPEVSSVSYLFTSRQGDVYLIILQLSEISGEAT